MHRETLVLTPADGLEPDVGLLLAAMMDARARTTERLEGLDADLVDLEPPGHVNGVGTLLYHIAAIEMDWLFVEILERPFPQHVTAMLPHDVRDDDGRLTPVRGRPLAAHVELLDATRSIFVEAMRTITSSDLYRVRSLEPYDVTPAWVVQHLMQHEASHRGQMLALMAAARRAAGGRRQAG